MKKLLSTVFIAALYLTNGAGAMEKVGTEIPADKIDSPTQVNVILGEKLKKDEVELRNELMSSAASILSNKDFEPTVFIFGVNNTRIDEVKNDMYDYIRKEYGAKVIFVSNHPEPSHYKVADAVWELSINSLELKDAELFFKKCQEEKKRPIALYPFSDQGTQMAALLSSLFGVPGCNPDEIIAALLKSMFREKERAIALAFPEALPPGYETIFSKKIFSLEEFEKILKEKPDLDIFFFKPDGEGNSRACFKVTRENYKEVWDKLKPYIEKGIEVEEFIDYNNYKEYCVDSYGFGKGGIFRKINTPDHGVEEKYYFVASYSVVNGETKFYGLSEYSGLTLKDLENMHRAAWFMYELCGGNKNKIGDTFHNELRYNLETKEIKAIEPNLRLPGGYIPYVINKSCVLVDPTTRENVRLSTHQLSLAAFAGDKILKDYELQKIKEARFSMVFSLQGGKIKELPSQNYVDELLKPYDGDFYWGMKIGDKAFAEPENNAHRVAAFVIYGKDPEVLEEASREILQQIQKEIIVE